MAAIACLQAWLTAQRMNHTQTPTSLGAGSTTQNLREPENTLSGKPRISTFARGGIVFPNPAVAFFYQSGTFAHRGARTSQFAIAPRGIGPLHYRGPHPAHWRSHSSASGPMVDCQLHSVPTTHSPTSSEHNHASRRAGGCDS